MADTEQITNIAVQVEYAEIEQIIFTNVALIVEYDDDDNKKTFAWQIMS